MINSFGGEFSFLSNFYKSNIEINGIIFPTAEHAYQDSKTDNKKWQIKISNAETPGKAKRLGNKTPLRTDWDNIKFSIMLDIIRNKFIQKTSLAKKLFNTFPKQLVEGNYWHDNYWGNCECDKCKFIIGENMLGAILMHIRKRLMEG